MRKQVGLESKLEMDLVDLIARVMAVGDCHNLQKYEALKVNYAVRAWKVNFHAHDCAYYCSKVRMTVLDWRSLEY